MIQMAGGPSSCEKADICKTICPDHGCGDQALDLSVVLCQSAAGGNGVSGFTERIAAG